MSKLLQKLAPSAATRRKIGYTSRSLRSPLLIIGGLGFLCGAAYVWEMIAGLCATGISLLVLEICSREDGR